MIWKGSWDTLRGDGVLPSSFKATFTWSELNRLFFIEGALTIFTALIAVFVLPDFPSASHRWLSPIEARLAQKRVEEDAGVDDEDQTEVRSQGQILRDVLTDWRVVYMTLKCAILHFSERAQLIYFMKHHLYHFLPLIYPVLSHHHRYTRV